MAAAAIIIILLAAGALLLVAALIGALVVVGRGARPADTPAATLVAAGRHARVTGVLALAGGGAVAAALLIGGAGQGPIRLSGVPGLPAALSLLVGALVYLAVHAVGERSWPRPIGAVRSASLRRRDVPELAGRRAWLLAGTTVLGALCLGAFALTADATGRAVPKLITSEAAAQGFGGGASGPYPGPPYAWPLIGALLAVAVATWAVLHLVTRRPAVAGTREADDLALRRTSARWVLAVAQLAVGGTVAAVCLVACAALFRAGWPLAGWVTLALGPAVGIVSLVAAGSALAPARTSVAARGATGDRAAAQA